MNIHSAWPPSLRALLGLVLLAVAAHWPPAAAQQAAGTPYEVTIQGVPGDGPVAAAVRASSTLVRLAESNEEPPGPQGLIRRAAGDHRAIIQGIRSLGFYGAAVTITVEGEEVAPARWSPDLEQRLQGLGRPARIAIAVERGPPYRIDDIMIAMADERGAGLAIDPWGLGIPPGDQARAAAVLRAEDRLADRMLELGHPFARVAGRRVTVDHAARTMQIVYTIEPGVEAPLGVVTFEGQERTRTGFLQRQVPFQPGTPFRPAEIEQLQAELRELAIFSTVVVEPPERIDPDGTVPILVRVEERPARVIGFGAHYATDVGLGLEAYWGHRNLFGGAENLRLSAEVGGLGGSAQSGLNYQVGARLRVPDFLADDNALITELRVLQEHPDAFERFAIEASGILERRFTERWRGSGGITAVWQTLTDEEGVSEDLTLVSLPFAARYDGSDDLLNPSRGWRLDLELEPFMVVTGRSGNWTRVAAEASTYFDVIGEGRGVIALRGEVAALYGAEVDDVPISHRLFSGGGGSVRGFAFQSVGPLDGDGDPLGGAGLVELGAEYRHRIGESWGAVVFVDAGQVVDDPVPTFDDPLIGAGVGVRYYTSFGPIRLDLAIPVNGRDRDDAYQIYVSIGQSF